MMTAESMKRLYISRLVSSNVNLRPYFVLMMEENETNGF